MARRFDLSGTWTFATADGRSGTMPVPSNWHLRGLPDYAGRVTFHRTFELPPLAPRERAWLRFEGVDYEATVSLNGRPVGFHRGYFAPFEFEVTTLLRPGENELSVEVNSPKDPPGSWPNDKVVIKGVLNHHDCRPGSWDPERGQDGNTGGIWGPVELLLDEGVRVHAVRAAPFLQPDGSARVAVEADISWAGSEELAWSLEVVDPHGTTAASAEGRESGLPGRRTLSCVVTVREPRLWWTWDHGLPNLYRLRMTARLPDGASDTLERRFGIRELRIDADWTWRLNGRRIFPRGTNIIPTQWLSEYTPERIAQDVELLRRANINAVRVHAHVNRRELYDALDEAGILCWQDFALQWSYAECDAVAEECRRQIQEMVHHLFNHPSIVVWCCHNEPAKNRRSLDPMLAAAVREADGTRHVEEASDFRYHPYPGWYYGHWREFAEAPGAPFVNEFGAQALMNVDSMREAFGDAAWPPDWARWAYHDFQYRETFHIAGVSMGASLEEFVANSQEYQARLLKFAIEQYRLRRFRPGDRPVTGIFQFMFMDCWPAITWSVVDYWRRPKRGYEALRLAYQPVLPVIRPSFGGDVAAAGSEVRFDVPVVNDLPRGWDTVTVEFAVRAPDGSPAFSFSGTGSVPADTVHRAARNIAWRIPPEPPEGAYRAEVRLVRPDGEVLGENWYEFRVVQVPRGAYHAAEIE
jgi:beta-mannosidase